METISNITVEEARQILAAEQLVKALGRQALRETVPPYDDEQYAILIEL